MNLSEKFENDFEFALSEGLTPKEMLENIDEAIDNDLIYLTKILKLSDMNSESIEILKNLEDMIILRSMLLDKNL